MQWLWVLVIGAAIGAFAGAIISSDKSLGWISNIVVGMVGAMLGEWLLGTWGPKLAEIASIPAVVGAIILILGVTTLMQRVYAISNWKFKSKKR
ncbi:GlsB/YeaQ/YmgE family stress response membrane protein [Lactiplantibacillus herbarum]|uniref:GlsB/YeaQ/YmgE family stress response membrane protein n=1 Tax=Lactiplantibacillus herbarum TaxID=1670446 RepID=UPI00064E8B3B|nr:GlsB/YeaQ/YmgE family stress response membrane protein [Lactiplantibacillus herbarum]